MNKNIDLDDTLNKLVEVSLGVYQRNSKPIEENWKLALSLELQGWIIARYEPSNERKDAIKFVFSKDSIEKEVLMGYADQQKWFEFVSKREANDR